MIFLTDNFPNGNGFTPGEDKFSDAEKIKYSEDSQNQGNSTENNNSGYGYPYSGTYGYNNQPPYGQGYPGGGYYGRKPSVIKRLTVFFTDKSVLPLSMASIAVAVAIILFRIFGSLFSMLLFFLPLLFLIFLAKIFHNIFSGY